MNQTIKETTEKCQKAAAEEAARVAQLHADEVERHDIRYCNGSSGTF